MNKIYIGKKNLPPVPKEGDMLIILDEEDPFVDLLNDEIKKYGYSNNTKKKETN